MSTAYVFTVHQYIGKNHMFPCSNITSWLFPQLEYYPTFRLFHFWLHPKLKKNTHPRIPPRNSLENLDPNAKPPRPQPTGVTQQTVSRPSDVRSGSHRRRNYPRPEGVTFREKNIKKKTDIFENTPCSIVQKKNMITFKLSWCVYVDGFVLDGLMNRSS